MGYNNQRKEILLRDRRLYPLMVSLEQRVAIDEYLNKTPEKIDFGDFSIVNFYSSYQKKYFDDFLKTPFFIPEYYTKDTKKPFPIYSMDKELLSNTGKNKNPFFDEAIIQYSIAYDDKNRPIGRAASFIDFSYNEENKAIGEGDVGWIGFFESVNNKRVGEELLTMQEDFLRDNGAKQILGPAQFNANGEIGLLVEGFENHPFFMEPYHASHYKDFFESRGYKVRELDKALYHAGITGSMDKKKKDRWFSFLIDSENLSEKDMRYIELAKKGFERRNGDSFNSNKNNRDDQKIKYRIRKIDIDEFENDANEILNLYNSVWGKGTHPEQRKLRKGEIEKLVDDVRLVALPSYVLVAEREYPNGKSEVVGTLVACLDINETVNQYDLSFRNRVGEMLRQGRNEDAYKIIEKEVKRPFVRDLGIIKTHMKKIDNTYQRGMRNITFSEEELNKVWRSIESENNSHLDRLTMLFAEKAVNFGKYHPNETSSKLILDTFKEGLEHLYNTSGNERNNGQLKVLENTIDDFYEKYGKRISRTQFGSMVKSLEKVIYDTEQSIDAHPVKLGLSYMREWLKVKEKEHLLNSIEKEKFSLFPKAVKMLKWLPSPKRARELKNEVYNNARVLIMGLKEKDRKKLVAENMMVRFMDNLKEITPSVTKISGSEVAELNQDMFLMLQKIGEKSLHWNVYHKDIDKKQDP